MMRFLAVLAVCFSVLSSGCIVSKKDYMLKVDEAQTCSKKLEQAVQENQGLRKELSAAQAQLQDCDRKGQDLSGQLSAASRERDGLNERLKAQTAVADELKSQNDRLNDLLQQKEVSQSQVIKETMDINKKLQGTNAELREKVASCETENRRLRDDLSAAAAGQSAVAAERDALKGQNQALASQIDELKKRKDQELEKLKSAYDELVSGLKGEIEAGQIQIRRMKDRLSVNLVEKILFDSGSAAIKPSGLDVLRKVGGELAKIEGKRVQIEGHTDNVPIGGRLKERFPTNWELSAARALAVVRFLQEEVDIDPVNLSGASYGQYQPAAENDTTEGKASNRRIEIVLLPPYERIGEAQETTIAPSQP